MIIQKIKNFLFPKSIAAKLAEACSTVSGLAKRGDNGEYKYLRIVDIAEALRDEIFSRGLAIIPNDVECHERLFPSSIEGRPYSEIWIKTEFTVSDGRHEEIYSAYGVGRDMDGKALFAAQTGALKSWLKRLGLIFGERDDPEVEARPVERPVEELPKQKAAQLRYQERAWAAALETCGKTKERIEQILSEAMGEAVTSELIVRLPRSDFDVAMKILAKNSDLTEVLEESRRAASRKRGRQAQPIVEALDNQPADEITH